MKQLWDRALAPFPPAGTPRRQLSASRPPMHQNSMLRTRVAPGLGTRRRYARKIFDGRGLYLLVTPSGGRYWLWNYRFNGKLKTLALGVHHDVSLDKARARHQAARTLLADGIEPSARKRAGAAAAASGPGR